MASLLKHAHCIAKLSKPAISMLPAYRPAMPSLDIFHPEVSQPAYTLPNEIPSFTGPEYDSGDESEDESHRFNALISTCYKKVANHVWPVRMTLPEEYCIVRMIPSDPMLSLPILPTHPPDFILSKKFTQEHMEKMNINRSGFLWPDEEKLVLFLIKAQEGGIAWDASERGNFQKDYFDPVVIPTIEHIPWVERNIPIPPDIYDKVIKILKEKIQVGVYERSNSAYQSKWFCIPIKVVLHTEKGWEIPLARS